MDVVSEQAAKRSLRKPFGKLLVCEGDPNLREAFKLMLGAQYELVFAGDPAEIAPLLGQHTVRRMVWHLDRPPGPFVERFRQALRADDPLDAYRKARAVYFNDCLEILKVTCHAYPELHVLLLASDYELNFQIAALQCGRVNFLPDTWKNPQGFVEQLQVLMGDKKSSIRHWVVRLPEKTRMTPNG